MSIPKRGAHLIFNYHSDQMNTTSTMLSIPNGSIGIHNPDNNYTTSTSSYLTLSTTKFKTLKLKLSKKDFGDFYERSLPRLLEILTSEGWTIDKITT